MPRGVAKKPVCGLHTAFIERIFLEEPWPGEQQVFNIFTCKVAFK